MPVTVQDPTPASFTPVNMFAMLRALINAGCPIMVNAGAPTNGTNGTFVGAAGFMSQLIDVTNGNIYLNTGTITNVNWVLTDGNSSLLTTSVTLTSAQVKAARATPITILPAPGAGKVNRIISASGYIAYGGNNAFTNPQNFSMKYKDGTTTALNVFTAAGWLDQTASEQQQSVLVAGVIISKANSDNQPVVIHNVGGSEITGNAAGDNTMTFKVAYAVDSVTW